jgi:hypothetical protein
MYFSFKPGGSNDLSVEELSPLRIERGCKYTLSAQLLSELSLSLLGRKPPGSLTWCACPSDEPLSLSLAPYEYEETTDSTEACGLC